jgi:nucleoside-diphosphate-sugar epimerase
MYSLKEYSKCKDVIFISTSQVHHSDLDKTDNQYAIAKLEAEEFLRNFTKYNKDYRISTIRPSNIIGSIEPLGDDPKDSVSLPTMLARISVGRREYDGMIYVYSSETTKDSSFERDYIHMSDVVKAIKIVVNRIETSDSLDSYSTYELNSGERASVLDLVEKYWEESRKFRTRVEMIGPRCGDGDLPETLPSTLLLESLGWVRSKSLLDGIQDSYLFYKNNPMGYRDEMITQWRR